MKYTVSYLLDELLEVTDYLEQALAITSAMKDLFFDNENIANEISKSPVLYDFDNTRLLLKTVNELLCQSHDKMDSFQDKAAKNLNVEIAEV